MPLEDLNSFDLVLKPDADGKVGLVITDAGVTQDPQRRLELLRQKVSNYFSAVVNGELKETFPNSKTSDFFIKVVCHTPPTPEMFEITTLRSRSKPENQVEVIFEQPDGRLWPGAKMPIADTIPSEASLSAALKELVKHALDFGFDTLVDKNFILFAEWNDKGERHVACLPGDAAASMDAGIRMAADLPPSATQFVLVYDAFITRDGAQHDALLARASERGSKQGAIFALEYEPGKWLRKPRRRREPYLLDVCPNDLDYE